MEAHVITILKLAGLSAVLSAGLVTGFPGAEQAPAPQPGKVFYDRVQDGAVPTTVLASIDPRALAAVDVNRSDKAHRIRTGDELRCTDHAWLLAAANCAPSFGLSSGRTSEVRSPGNVSVLIRDAAPGALASR
jgi:hypothetical protein